MNIGITVTTKSGSQAIILTEGTDNLRKLVVATEETQTGQLFEIASGVWHFAPFTGKPQVGTLAEIQDYIWSL